MYKSLASGRSSFLLHRLTGRLGNQLWGLSEAYRLARHFKKQVLLDLGDNPINELPIPVLKFILSQDWLEVRKFRAIHSKIHYSPLSENVYSGFTEHNLIFQGFIATYASLKKSGLYTEGKLPSFLENCVIENSMDYVSIHVRQGDYHRNPHLGVLPKAYYRKALYLLTSELLTQELAFAVFGDESFQMRLSTLPKKYHKKVLRFKSESSLLEEFATMANGRAMILSNSTLAYLASFFSQSELTILPNPFYLSVPGWNEALRSSRTKEVNYTLSPKLRYLRLRTKKKLMQTCN